MAEGWTDEFKSAGGGDNWADEFKPAPQRSTAGAPSMAEGLGRSFADLPIIGPVANKLDAATNALAAPYVDRFLPENYEKLPEATFGERYQHALDIQNRKNTQFQQQHPIASTAANVAGNLAATIPLAATTTGARALGLVGGGLGKLMAAGAASGAGINAVDALMRGEDPTTAAELGGGIGAAIPGVNAVTRGIARGVRSAVQPFTEGGREARANEIISRMAEGGPTTSRMSPVVGSEPTTAQAMANPGLAGLERHLRNMPGEIGAQFTERDAANAAAREQAYRSLAGDEMSLDRLREERSQAAAQNKGAAFANAGAADVQDVVRTIDKVLASPEGQRNAVASALQDIRSKLVLDKAGTLQTDPAMLYGIRQSASDMMRFNFSPQKLASKQLIEIQQGLDQAIEKVAPGYKNYMQQYAEQSRPIDVQELLQKANVFDSKGNLTLGNLDRTINNIEKTRQFKGGANQAKSLSDSELNELKAIREDLQMAQNSSLGKAIGSNTAQNLLANSALNEFLQRHAAMAGIGGVMGAASDIAQGKSPGTGLLTGLGAAGLLSARARGNTAIIRKVASKMLSPAEGARALKAAKSTGAKGLNIGHRITNPVLARAIVRQLTLPPSSN